MNWTTAPWLVIDTETTGLQPPEDRIIELAAVSFRDGEPTERKAQLVNPARAIPAESTAVHGIRDEDVAAKPRIAEIGDRFLTALRDAPIIVAYNAPFDFAFLAAELPGWTEALAGKCILDPLVIVRLEAVGKFWSGPGRHKLDAVYRRLALPDTGRAHRASTDAIMAGRVLWNLRAHLPDDAEAASTFIAAQRLKQDADFERWKATAPKR